MPKHAAALMLLCGLWVSAALATAAPEPSGKERTIFFEDSFAGPMKPDWNWVREDPNAWRFEKNALRINTQPGSLWLNDNTTKNLLLRPAPAMNGRLGFSVEVLLGSDPRSYFEHAGLICYYDDDHWAALVKEFTGESSLSVLSEDLPKPVQTAPNKEPADRALWLRLEVARGRVVGKHRSVAKERVWKTVGEVPLPKSDKPL